jgi:hypothetical protein
VDPKNLTGLLTRLSQEARAALPQNCSMTTISGWRNSGNGTVVPDPATNVPSIHGDVIFCNIDGQTKYMVLRFAADDKGIGFTGGRGRPLV